jgi:hypothetical protein
LYFARSAPNRNLATEIDADARNGTAPCNLVDADDAVVDGIRRWRSA